MPNNDIAVVMITTDRARYGKDNHYFYATLLNMDRAGVWFSPWLNGMFVSGSRLSDRNWLEGELHRARKSSLSGDRPKIDYDCHDFQANENVAYALLYGAETMGADWILFCEDDLDFCDDFLGSVGRWLDDYADDDRYLLYTFGTPYEAVNKPDPFTHNSWRYPVDWFYGTQCFAIRPEAALSLSSYLSTNPPILGVDNPNAYDLMFKDWAKIYAPNKTFLASVPSFVQHIGRASICTGKDVTHTFDSWPGREWSYHSPTLLCPICARVKSDEVHDPNYCGASAHSFISRNPRVLFVGDAVVSTGFSNCTHAVCDHLHSSGYDVTVLGISYYGDPHHYPYTIYPAVSPIDGCTDYCGASRLPFIIDRVKPDVIVLLNDPWNIPAYLDLIRNAYEIAEKSNIPFHVPPIIGYLAVDSRNHKGSELNDLNHIVTWTNFGCNELVSGGYTGPTSVVSLGVDTSIFYPRDRAESRSMVCSDDRIPPDAYIVGVVGRNQPRKRLDLALEYFAEWIRSKEVDNAYLYLYTSPTGERSCDIGSLTKYYGLSGRVIVNTPSVGHGNPIEIMPYVYSAFDVFLSTSQAEGFCLPALEAMACGIPCILPDSGGFEWAGNVAIKVKCSTTALTAPLNGMPYTIGAIPDKSETVQCLSVVYKYLKGYQRDSKVEKGIALASTLTWKRTGEEFERVVRKVIGWDQDVVEEVNAPYTDGYRVMKFSDIS